MAAYTRAIVDELGHLVEYASDLTGAEINEILEEHPEYRLTTIMVANAYYGDIESEGF